MRRLIAFALPTLLAGLMIQSVNSKRVIPRLFCRNSPTGDRLSEQKQSMLKQAVTEKYHEILDKILEEEMTDMERFGKLFEELDKKYEEAKLVEKQNKENEELKDELKEATKAAKDLAKAAEKKFKAAEKAHKEATKEKKKAEEDAAKRAKDEENDARKLRASRELVCNEECWCWCGCCHIPSCNYPANLASWGCDDRRSLEETDTKLVTEPTSEVELVHNVRLLGSTEDEDEINPCANSFKAFEEATKYILDQLEEGEPGHEVLQSCELQCFEVNDA